jgi:hypothetical protein
MQYSFLLFSIILFSFICLSTRNEKFIPTYYCHKKDNFYHTRRTRNFVFIIFDKKPWQCLQELAATVTVSNKIQINQPNLKMDSFQALMTILAAATTKQAPALCVKQPW